MIQVESLTKRYGFRTAVQDVTFEVQRGEILGFLGPNGAGKTTTMRILSGYLPADEGRAVVAGFDVFEQPLEAKRRIGYLPEQPPLYTEMTVDGFLDFVARIKGVAPADRSERLQYVKDRCGLNDIGSRLVKHLSKGYRQRVGLAQALIHDPDVLILDEPTIGLDPKQIIEVRELIKSLGGDHTIILSTHILPEVSMTCQRVVIINAGRIVAIDTPENLIYQLTGGQRIEVEIGGSAAELIEVIERLPGVRKVVDQGAQDGRRLLVVEAEGKTEIRPELAKLIVDGGGELYRMQPERMSLEEVFLRLTTEESEEEAAR
ncbi:MAG TPA: ATP-binding cassette domain-containing protein [Acidobacteriota bacterium]|jgi:ABC-2 type transport system ATP-binding protein|nr:ATP-binding cassette domain-containing protein [Acidobacteriota bacterium]HRR55602.1 ATP-binding cassette domain-containing protein [Acidobacteriota bacterium]HRV07525.1 ATP-binding cassette domain-containing protein [Acidobacteriota bacterium]